MESRGLVPLVLFDRAIGIVFVDGRRPDRRALASIRTNVAFGEIPGIEQPRPTIMGMKLLPCRPKRWSTRSVRNAVRAM